MYENIKQQLQSITNIRAFNIEAIKERIPLLQTILTKILTEYALLFDNINSSITNTTFYSLELLLHICSKQNVDKHKQLIDTLFADFPVSIYRTTPDYISNNFKGLLFNRFNSSHLLYTLSCLLLTHNINTSITDEQLLKQTLTEIDGKTYYELSLSTQNKYIVLILNGKISVERKISDTLWEVFLERNNHLEIVVKERYEGNIRIRLNADAELKIYLIDVISFDNLLTINLNREINDVIEVTLKSYIDCSLTVKVDNLQEMTVIPHKTTYNGEEYYIYTFVVDLQNVNTLLLLLPDFDMLNVLYTEPKQLLKAKFLYGLFKCLRWEVL